MSHTKRRREVGFFAEPKKVSRRDVLVGGVGLGALAALGCSGDSATQPSGTIVPGTGGFAGGSGAGAGTGGALGGGGGGSQAYTAGNGAAGSGEPSGTAGTVAEGQPELVILGEPEISSKLWQMITPYARASLDGSYGTRVNLYNPADVPQRVVIQAFLMTGELVVKHELSAAFEPQRSLHFDLGDYLREQRVPLPFEGSLWIGATPQSGLTFMGLQGISLDWWGRRTWRASTACATSETRTTTRCGRT